MVLSTRTTKAMKTLGVLAKYSKYKLKDRGKYFLR